MTTPSSSLPDIMHVFTPGPISTELIASCIAEHQTTTSIGAYDIFLGQVRADVIDGKTVKAISYSAYEKMAIPVFRAISEEASEKFGLMSLRIYHSLGEVRAGQICLFVLASSAHRADAMNACRYVVEELKVRVPIFGKELLEDGAHVWKENTPKETSPN